MEYHEFASIVYYTKQMHAWNSQCAVLSADAGLLVNPT